MICQCPQAVTQTIKLLVDSGADVSFIKVSSFKDEIRVSEPTDQNLTGITGHTLQSLGTTNLTLQIGQEERTAQFHIAPSTFLVPYDGVLGKFFIIGLETILDYNKKQLILTDHESNRHTTVHSKSKNFTEHSKTSDSQESLKLKNAKITIPSRNEILFGIPTPDYQEDETILVPAQMLDESILCSNTINLVRDQILIYL